MEYELIVIGGGPIGLSTAYHAAKREKKTLVIEQFGYFNNLGSSAGDSRQFRVQYAQEYMAELVMAAEEYWVELQNQTRNVLITDVGSVWFGDSAASSQEGGIEDAEKVMENLAIPYSKLDSNEIENRFNFKDLPEGYDGFFQANGGVINLKATEQVMYDVALSSGHVDFLEYHQVTNVTSDDHEVVVTANNQKFRAKKLAITAGVYSNNVTDKMGFVAPIKIWQMSSAYFKKKDPHAWFPTWFSFASSEDADALGNPYDFYGFPEVDWSYPGYIRVAPDFPDKVMENPTERSFVPSDINLGLTSDWVRDHMKGLDPTPNFTSTCIIALSNDANKELLMDYAPASCKNHNNIVVYTAGWAAKFIPLLGDTICQMLEKPITEVTYGGVTFDLSNFSINWQPSQS